MEQKRCAKKRRRAENPKNDKHLPSGCDNNTAQNGTNTTVADLDEEPSSKVEAMPIDYGDPYYKMSYSQRGLLIIFNHEEYVHPYSDKKFNRTGTARDVEKIRDCFEPIGFRVEHNQDFTLKQIQDRIIDCTREDHSDRDCLAIFVLSHGDGNRIFAKDDWYSPAEELWGKLNSYNCPSLHGKPKLIFLQACQGDKWDRGIDVHAPITCDSTDSVQVSYKLPVCADFLIVQATFEGYYAFLNPITGSAWITILCQELQKNYTRLDILTLLTNVHRRMARDYNAGPVKIMKIIEYNLQQMPYFKSSLTRSLIFGEKNLEQ